MTSSPSPEPLQPRPESPPIIAVVGLTASGKSEWAMQIAGHLDGEIVSIDSRQIYRRLDIGTAKPSPEMMAEIPHWCVDIVEPSERYSLGEYLSVARSAIADIRSRGRRVVVVGGSGQHMRALLEGWVIPPVAEDAELREQLAAKPSDDLFQELQRVDQTAAEQIGSTNVRRIIRALEVHRITGTPISEWQRRREPISYQAFAPDIALEKLDPRIERRTAVMFESGFVDEVRTLLDEGIPESAPGFDSIGYREVLAHLRGELSQTEAQAAVAQATRRFARRQRAWFRRDDPSICWSADAPLGMLE